ncbi:MAG: hypothetical protein JXR95_03860 [Deltaproteobacteria bacterium]|nr:hypothetical protein [Deltaproteobacteria bacterium]
MKLNAKKLVIFSGISALLVAVSLSAVALRVYQLRNTTTSDPGYDAWFNASQKLPFSTLKENNLQKILISGKVPEINKTVYMLAAGLNDGSFCRNIPRPHGVNRYLSFMSAFFFIFFILSVVLFIYKVFNKSLKFNVSAFRKFGPLCIITLFLWMILARVS